MVHTSPSSICRCSLTSLETAPCRQSHTVSDKKRHKGHPPQGRSRDLPCIANRNGLLSPLAPTIKSNCPTTASKCHSAALHFATAPVSLSPAKQSTIQITKWSQYLPRLKPKSKTPQNLTSGRGVARALDWPPTICSVAASRDHNCDSSSRVPVFADRSCLGRVG